MPSCFGASPSGDFMYSSGRAVCLRIYLVNARFLMSFVIAVGSLRAEWQVVPEDEFQWGCIADKLSVADYIHERVL